MSEVENGENCVTGTVSVFEGEKVLKMNGSDDCMTVFSAAELCT